MMPRNAKRHQLADSISPTLDGNFGSGSSMID
jgi:hypothetical protein